MCKLAKCTFNNATNCILFTVNGIIIIWQIHSFVRYGICLRL